MIVFLLGMGKKEKCVLVSQALYTQQKSRNAAYELKQKLSPDMDVRLYATYPTAESFMTSIGLDEKDKKLSSELQKKLLIAAAQADEFAIAKKFSCPLIITEKQIWVTDAAKKAGIEAKVFR